MFWSTAIFALVGLILTLVNLRQGRHRRGLVAGLQLGRGVLPVVLVAFVLAGMIEALIPQEFVHHWLAREAGWRGVFLGLVGGALLAMGPYAAFPIIASVHSAGAGLGTVVALVIAWAVLRVSHLPFDLGFFGARFTLIRLSLSIPLCLAAALAAHLVEGWFLLLS